jgi:hypothetical protein
MTNVSFSSWFESSALGPNLLLLLETSWKYPMGEPYFSEVFLELEYLLRCLLDSSCIQFFSMENNIH